MKRKRNLPDVTLSRITLALRPGYHSSMLPPDLDIWTVFAIGLVFAAWAAYAPLLAAFGRGTLNAQLHAVRRRWMRLSTSRENRTFDGVLLGHITNAMAFFGSATLIVLAGLLGALANVKSLYAMIAELHFLDASLSLFALKLAVVTFVLGWSFFAFTYALRKLSYTLALLGALPDGPDGTAAGDVMIEETATVLTEAVKSFNNGIRGYYFAVAALMLFVGPVASMLTTLAVMALLLFRQTASRTARAIGRYVDAVESSAKGEGR
jgi:uncharacterized membrane protein